MLSIILSARLTHPDYASLVTPLCYAKRGNSHSFFTNPLSAVGEERVAAKQRGVSPDGDISLPIYSEPMRQHAVL